MECMFNPQGFINSVKQEIVRAYSKDTSISQHFKIGSMFMLTWVHEDNKRGKNKEDPTECLKTVKLSRLTLEGAVFNGRELEDHREKMLQTDVVLKISFYSKTAGQFYRISNLDKDMDKETGTSFIKSELDANTKESDKRIMVPI